MVVYHPSYAQLPQEYRDLETRIESSTKSGRGNVNNEKIFIAANIINEELIRGAWRERLHSLVDLLGEENVFVSIYENDSGQGTSRALRQLQEQLRCNSSVVTGEHVPLSYFPTVRLPDGEQRVQRLDYLAEIRNRLLRPIDPSYRDNYTIGFRKADHVQFDRILFLNDVYYSPIEAIHLLFSTNAGTGRAQYRAACAIDFIRLNTLYDTFVIRDTDGYETSYRFFPWFSRQGRGISRGDVLSMTDSVRVRSCWSGMAAFDAAMFQPKVSSNFVPPSTQHQNQTLTLKFRSGREPFWEAAECCLIFADMENEHGQPSELAGSGVFVNPYVRVAYSPTTWSWLPFFKRYERIFEPFQGFANLISPPEHNPRRTHEPGQTVNELVWVETNYTLTENPHHGNSGGVQQQQFGHFETLQRVAGPGGFCGQRRMFVMKKDLEAANRDYWGRNWENVRVPQHLELS